MKRTWEVRELEYKDVKTSKAKQKLQLVEQVRTESYQNVIELSNIIHEIDYFLAKAEQKAPISHKNQIHQKSL